MIFVGHDWAERHHDICVEDQDGKVLAEARFPESVEGLAGLHKLIGSHVEDPDNPADVIVGTETDKGFFVKSMISSGYAVYAINPLAASRYRSRHSTSGAKSDKADAKLLAEIVRTDRQNHRLVVCTSTEADIIKVLARTHQQLIWDRVRYENVLRSTLREYFPAALEAFGDLDHSDAIAVLEIAPTPALGERLSLKKIQSALKSGGRQRNIETRAAEIHACFRSEHLEPNPSLADSLGSIAMTYVKLLSACTEQINRLETELAKHFEKHPDAEIICGLPGLGTILGARVLGEFGDDPNRYANAKARKNAAGTSPVTKASGTKTVVIRRFVKNNRCATACQQWAFSSLKASPGARAFYDSQRARGKSHNQALRALANRLVGILHVCLERREHYNENKAWPTRESKSQAA